MASLEKRSNLYRVVFMFGGRRHSYSLGTGTTALKPKPCVAALKRR